MNTFLKRTLILLSIIALGLFLYSTFVENLFKSRLSPKDTVEFKLNDLTLEIFYNRPLRKDREIFGALVPYNKVWRTGANEAPEITFYADMMLGNTKVAAGAYSLLTIPGNKEWTIIINKDLLTQPDF